MSFFSGLFHRFRGALDPNRLAMSQAFLAGDYGSAAERFRQLQAEHERLRMWGRKKQRNEPPLDAFGDGSVRPEALGQPEFSQPMFPRTDSGAGLWNGGGGPGVDEAFRNAEPGPDMPDDLMFPLAANSGPAQRGDAKLRAKQPPTNAGERPFRGNGRLGISAQVPQPSLVDAITAPAVQQARDARNAIPPGADGRIGNSYADSDYLLIEEPIERQYGLPTGILSRIRMRGERSNADQISPDGAQSVYQIIPSTRDSFLRVHGVDAWAGPEQAARVAALHLRESYRNHRDWNRAVLDYHGSPDPRNWGPRTRAYGRRVGDVNGRR